LQIKYINRALQRWNSTQVIPTQFVLFTLSVIIGSAVLYKDFEKADGPRIAKFVSGCFLTFMGVYLITTGRSGRSRKDEEEYSEGDGDSNGSYTDSERYVDEEDTDSDQDLKPKIVLSQHPSQEDLNNPSKDYESPSQSPSLNAKQEREQQQKQQQEEEETRPERKNRSASSRASSLAISEVSNSPLPPIRPTLNTLRSKSHLSSRSNKSSSRPASASQARIYAATGSTETTPLFPYHTTHRPKTLSSRDSIPVPPLPLSSSSIASTSVPQYHNSNRHHRSSMSIITPGPLFVGYQLQAIVAAQRGDFENSGSGGGGFNSSSGSLVGSISNSKKRAELRKTKSHGSGMIPSNTTTSSTSGIMGSGRDGRRKKSPAGNLLGPDGDDDDDGDRGDEFSQQQQQQLQQRRETVAEAEGLASSSSKGVVGMSL